MPLQPEDQSHGAGPTLRLQLTGDLDVLTAHEELKRILVEGRQAGNSVELDLSGVEFIDSSGISMLIEARKHFEGANRALVVVNPSDAVRRVLVLTGLTETFGVIPTPTEPSEG